MEYSSVSDTIEKVNLTEMALLSHVIEDAASYISERYHELLSMAPGEYFDDTLALKPADDNISRDAWVDLIASCGASVGQLGRVRRRIDEEVKDLKEELEDLDETEDADEIAEIKKRIEQLSR
jgi:hypothetical protein